MGGGVWPDCAKFWLFCTSFIAVLFCRPLSISGAVEKERLRTLPEVGKSDIIGKLQDILDMKAPVIALSDGGTRDSDKEKDLPQNFNVNYTKVEEE